MFGIVFETHLFAGELWSRRGRVPLPDLQESEQSKENSAIEEDVAQNVEHEPLPVMGAETCQSS